MKCFPCCNSNLGLMTKARVCNGVGQKGSPRVTFHVPRSVGKCEGMNPHTPKWAPTLGVGVLADFQFLRERLQGSKPIGLWSSLFHWKDLGTKMSKMGSHDPFEWSKHKLWPKERLGVKLAVWLLTIKSQKSPWFPWVKVACHILLESCRWGLQLCFKPHFNQRFAQKCIGLQSCISPNFENFEIPKLGVPG
jgi:hypothetical protein